MFCSIVAATVAFAFPQIGTLDCSPKPDPEYRQVLTDDTPPGLNMIWLVNVRSRHLVFEIDGVPAGLCLQIHYAVQALPWPWVVDVIDENPLGPFGSPDSGPLVTAVCAYPMD